MVKLGILSEGLPTTRKKLHERFYNHYKEKYPHQWSVVKFVEMLKTQPIDVAEVSESYTSSINPFNGEKLRKGKQVVERVIRVFNPYLMTGSAHEGGGVKVLKVNARYLESSEVLLERDSIAPLNLVRKVDGRVLVFPSTSPN